MATAAQAFPKEVPDVRSVLVISVGLVALIAIAREPEPPVALVDSRRKTQLEVSRLYAGRSLVAVMVFLAAFLSGAEAELIIPAALTVLLALVSNEVERVRRRGG